MGAPIWREFKPNASKRQAQSAGPAPASCEIEGNPDFYDLGIRTGIYLQWITAFIANHVLRRAIDSSLEINTVFLLALFIATVVATIKNTAQTAELVVLLHLCFGFLFSILSIWGHRTSTIDIHTKKIRFPLIGSLFRLSIATGLSAYGVWFWFRGRDLHRRANACSDYTFLFSRFDIAGGIRYFLEIQSSVICAVYAVLFVREVLMMVAFFLFLFIQTSIISGLAVWFGASGIIHLQRHKTVAKMGLRAEEAEMLEKKQRGRDILSMSWFLLKYWARLSLAMGWKGANGKQSAGEKRPDLKCYLIPFVDVYIFTFRTTVQFLCLLLFKWCPKIDFIPLIPYPFWVTAQKDTNAEPASPNYGKRIMAFLKSPPAEKLLRAANLFTIVWTMVSVELTLHCNKIIGVYTLDSIGQLIPFIIGVVGFLSLIHGISVERSKLVSTDVLLKLFDADQVPIARAVENHSGTDTDYHQLSLGYDAVFYVRKPEIISDEKVKKQGDFYKRRHSIDFIWPKHIQEDIGSDGICETPGTLDISKCNMIAVPWPNTTNQAI
ncbi:uncharacterized protein BCR38DRAFT_480379 [Pseudomassariella vexata]|uniref:Uncharacterized protein n=1 Tax=Pseudomassariella vexata TaxID=1141098 RepID=A0A1Y2EM31_9PEZI|nr:uncharacterized protein BCR38DRAFT_480379 [Pseudomassariella vexata]ORY71905.1 hypothetical protein BCR38DRAFT_480379 [Pseudomassariella vexata]